MIPPSSCSLFTLILSLQNIQSSYIRPYPNMQQSAASEVRIGPSQEEQSCLSSCIAWLDNKREIGEVMEPPQEDHFVFPAPPPPPKHVIDIYGDIWTRREEEIVTRADVVKKNLTRVDRSLIRKFEPRQNPAPQKDASKISKDTSETGSTLSSNGVVLRSRFNSDN